MDILKIYLHWTATNYAWALPGHYHSVVDNKGAVKRLTDYHTPLYEATYHRNTDSVSLAMACMKDGDWVNFGPTEAQLDGLAKEVAKVCLGLKWEADAKFLEHRVMTHAEAAALRDYPKEKVLPFSGKSPSSDWDHRAEELGLPHANYGPGSWFDFWPGGDTYRWDLWILHPDGVKGKGGYEMRNRIVQWMKAIAAKGGT